MKRKNEGTKVHLGKQKHQFSKKKFNKQLISVTSTALLLFSNYGLFPLQVLAEETTDTISETNEEIGSITQDPLAQTATTEPSSSTESEAAPITEAAPQQTTESIAEATTASSEQTEPLQRAAAVSEAESEELTDRTPRNLTWETRDIDSNTVEITGYIGNPTSIIIPSVIDNKSVVIDLKEVFGEALYETTTYFEIKESQPGFSPVKLTGTLDRLFYGDYTSNPLIEQVSFGDADITSIDSTFRMFSNCTNLTSLNVTGLDTSSVTSMREMFNGCSQLETLDLSGWNTSRVTLMYAMFDGCSSLKTLDLSGWNTSEVLDMSFMFRGCSELEPLDWSGWNTSSLDTMMFMFSGCSQLETLDLSGWNTSKVKNVFSMFDGCSGLKTLDLSGWNTSSWKDSAIFFMFAGCQNLTKLTISSEFEFKDADHGLLKLSDLGLGEKTKVYWEDNFAKTYNTTEEMIAAHNLLNDGEVHVYKIQKEHEVSFKLDGGSGNTPDSHYVFEGQTATDPNYSGTRGDQVFDGWRLNGAPFDITKDSINAPSELVATFRNKKYKVEFYPEKGSESFYSQDFEYSESKELTPNSFTKVGYHFKNWKTESGSTTYSNGQSVANLTDVDYGIVKLIAEWRANTYDIQFIANGGTGSMANQSMTYGEPKKLTDNSFARKGYQFVGWSTEPDGEIIYNDGESVQNLTTENNGTVPFYAQWKLDSGLVEKEIKKQAPTKVYNGNREHEFNVDLTSITEETAFPLKIKVTGTFASKDAKDQAFTIKSWEVVEGNAKIDPLAASFEIDKGKITPLELTQEQLVFTEGTETKTYDGRVTSELKGEIATNALLGSDEAKLVITNAEYDTKDVGTDKNITYVWNLDGPQSANYSLPQEREVKGTITKRAITPVWSKPEKPYDGTTAADVTVKLPEVVGTEDVKATFDANFKNADAGTDKEIDIQNVNLTGDDIGNYSIDEIGTTTGTIKKKDLKVTWSAEDREYNGTTDATVNGALDGVLLNEINNVEITGTGSFTNKDVGENKPVTITNTELTGSAAKNYQVSETADATVTISPYQIQDNQINFINRDKAFDTTKSASQLKATLQNGVPFADDKLSISITDATYNQSDIGNDIGITYNWALTGGDRKNYKLQEPLAVTGNIINADLTEETVIERIKLQAPTKEYNGEKGHTFEIDITELAEKKTRSTTKIILEVTGEFIQEDAGDRKFTVKSWNVTSGNAELSALTKPFTIDGKITQKALTAEWNKPTKEYDGKTAVEVVGTPEGLVGSDAVTISAKGNFKDNANVGPNKDIDIDEIKLEGTDAGNYSIDETSTTTGAITKYVLQADQIEFSKLNKEYDKSKASLLEATFKERVLFGEDKVAIEITEAAYADDQAGKEKAISYKWKLTGEQSGNYKLLDEVDVKGEITKKGLTAKWSNPTKIYNGLTAAAVTGELQGVISKDVVEVAFDDANYKDANASETKQVDINNIRLTGKDAGNYSMPDKATTTGIINPFVLQEDQIQFSEYNKVYDKEVDSRMKATIKDDVLVPSDKDKVAIEISEAAFADEQAGSGKAISYKWKLTGDQSRNYKLLEEVAVKGEITKKGLKATWSAADKVYDGTTKATVTGTLEGMIPGEETAVSINGTGEFTNKNVAGTIPVTITDSKLAGDGAKNYEVTETVDAKAKITAYQISEDQITFENLNKPFDTTDSAAQVTASLPEEVPFAKDDLSIGLTDAKYSQPNIGKELTITYNWTLTGKDAENYQLPGMPTVTGNITDAVLTEQAVIDQINKVKATKVYNGNENHKYTIDITELANKKTRTATKIELEVTGYFDQKTVDAKTFTVTGWKVISDNAEVPAFGKSFDIEGTITQKRISVDWDHPEKTYDGKDEVEISGTLKGLVEGDEVFATTTAIFVDANAGTNKEMIIPEAVVTGKDAANYLVLPSNNGDIKGTINAYELQPDQIEFTGLNKEYDNEVDSLLKAAIKDKVLFGKDKVAIKITKAEFNDVQAGKDKAISYSWTLTGEHSGNYSLPKEEKVAGEITPKALTAEWTAEGKVYDGTTEAAVTGKLTGLIGEDKVTVKGTGAFEDKNSGPDKKVDVTAIQLEGADAGNYTVPENSEIKAAILAYQIKEDQITFGNLNKPFDTTDSAAQVTANLPEEVPFAADDLSVALTDAVYAQSDIGEDIGISYEWALAGKDAQNYRLPEDKKVLQGNITEAVMTEAAVMEQIKQVTPTKVYDRNTDHTFTVNITDAAQRKTRDATQILLEVTGEFVQASAGEQVFNVTSWRVTSGNATLPALTKPFQVTGEIQPRAITVNWSAADKEYDGSLDTPLTAVCEDILPDDEVTFAATGTYDDKNCGSHEVRLDAASVQLSGAHAGNYIVETQNDTCNIEITPRPVTVEWQVADKVYDAKPDATVTGTLNNLVPDDEVMVATTAQFVDKNVGDNKPVHVNTPTFSGADHQNYTITAPAEVAATISPYNIQLDQISFGQTVKAFDQSAAAKLTARLIGLPLELDDLRIDITDARYPDSDIGENKAISYDWKLTGADEANYRLPEKPAVTGAIAAPTVGDDTQARIIELLKQQTPEKEYDGNSVHQFELDITSAFGEPTRRAATPTQILLNVTGTFEQSDAGERSFNVTDWNITSNNAVIGELPAGIVLEGTITKRVATIRWTVADKIYDGTTAATVQASVNGLVANDRVTVKGVGAFVDKNAGANKAVTITSSEVTGDAAVNYEFATPDIGITANIQQKALSIHGVQTVNRRANDSRLVDLVGTNAALEGVLPADQNAVGFNLGQGTMADAAAGNGKAVTTNIQLTGDEAGNYTLTQPTDLTVDITKKKVIVTIVDENGNKQEVELEEGAKLPRPKDPVKDGFTFEGWYADEALTQPFDFDQPITGNVTLYPKWSRNIPVATTTNRNIVTPRVVTSSGNTTTSSSGKSLPSTGDSLNNMWSMLGLGAIASAIAAWKKRKG
ncbi:BspA family leucine-rich repeat surface protein [Enterococcus sp. 669A]|uniref:BspA family leucine-rich repeat surface protein n=1 Tax=Candidatus Enterococcus moelleringii TaxID=2815325 RepID=A0ABS3L8Q9_9ENTE|nr:YDG domain-containing protein [Enterococcus sp. 669A]MBO1306029.1 BspA family leucine-rich repeat surface protein [Enterococcus sp. 669A]